MPPTFQLSSRALIGKTSSCLSASRMQKGYLRKVKDISFISTMPAPRGTSQQAALLRAPRFGGHPASRSEAQPCVARSAKQGGGDGLLSSPRQYSFSKALDTCSANSSSCPQVFHREPNSSRHDVAGSAGACTRVRRCARRAPFQHDPAVAPARARRAALPSHRGALCIAESAFTDWNEVRTPTN